MLFRDFAGAAPTTGQAHQYFGRVATEPSVRLCPDAWNDHYCHLSPTDGKAQATTAEPHFQQTGQLTVVILDNASVHKSQIATQQQECWQQQGLLLFFLPPGESSDESN